MKKNKFYIYSFYRFKKVTNLSKIKRKLNSDMNNKIIYGTVLLASEGINGTISGEKETLEFFIRKIKNYLRIKKISIKI